MRSSARLLGYDISTSDLATVVDEAWQRIQSRRRGQYVATANPHSLVVAREDGAFRAALQEADVLLPDGIGVVVAARMLRRPIAERVAGFEFFWALSKLAQTKGGVRYFFLGSTPEVLDRIREQLQRDFPAIEVVGCMSPPFKAEFSAEDEEAMVQAINRSGADVLWVGMTAPKQEKWIHRNRERLEVPLSGAIGAVFDFYAGTKPRAPEWVRNMGLEWLPRLAREPQRLWRRTFVSGPLFLGMVLREATRRDVEPRPPAAR